jgi:hypothetical protein
LLDLHIHGCIPHFHRYQIQTLAQLIFVTELIPLLFTRYLACRNPCFSRNGGRSCRFLVTFNYGLFKKISGADLHRSMSYSPEPCSWIFASTISRFEAFALFRKPR